jgi:hypothetical protein
LVHCAAQPSVQLTRHSRAVRHTTAPPRRAPHSRAGHMRTHECPYAEVAVRPLKAGGGRVNQAFLQLGAQPSDIPPIDIPPDSSFNLQASSFNPQSSSLKPQISIFKPQSSNINPQTSTSNFRCYIHSTSSFRGDQPSDIPPIDIPLDSSFKL